MESSSSEVDVSEFYIVEGPDQEDVMSEDNVMSENNVANNNASNDNNDSNDNSDQHEIPHEGDSENNNDESVNFVPYRYNVVEDIYPYEEHSPDSSDIDILDDSHDSCPSTDFNYGFSTSSSPVNMKMPETDFTSDSQQTWYLGALGFLWSEVKEMCYRCINDYINPNREFLKVTFAVTITLVALQLSYLEIGNAKTTKKEVDIQGQMLKRLQTLESENNELKNQVLSKIQNDKLFLLLEQQISHLKSENSKLSGTMDDLIQQLEEQTNIFKVENQNREKGIHDPYKKEIFKLKDQINILRFDNEDLQKQLVRMRYGGHPSREPSKDSSSKGKHHKHNKNNDQEHNPPADIVTEEINDLRRKVFSELEKLKNWKETVHKLIGELEKSQEDQSFRLDNGSQEKSKKHKGERFYDWFWKKIKKNINGKFENFPINFSEIFSKYVSIEKKNVENIYDSINHYFKKAHEKTSKVLIDFADDNMKSSLWNKITYWKQKLDEVGSNYFNSENDMSEELISPQILDSYLADHEKFRQNDKIMKGDSSDNVIENDIDREQAIHQNEKYPSIETNEGIVEDTAVESQISDSVYYNEEFKVVEEHNHLKDGEYKLDESTDIWLLGRAAQRSELRQESEDVSQDVNWFLQKNKNKHQD